MGMQRTFASLLVALAASVLAIAAAYIVGQRSAELRMREDVARSEERQRAMVDELRRELAPRPAAESEAPVVSKVDAPPPTATPEPAPAPEPVAPPPAPEPAQATPAEEPAPTSAVLATADPVAKNVSEAAPQVPADPAIGGPISRDQFDAVDLGVTYSDAAAKLGREGRIAMTMNDASGSQTMQYVWQWTGANGEPGQIVMRFENGKLKDKKFSE